MIKLPLRLLCVSLAVLTMSAATRAAEPAIIAKARARHGAEAVLNALKSVHIVGTATTQDPNDPAKTIRSTVEFIYQKPHQQKITATNDTIIETTALDGYEGWTLIQDPKQPARRRLTLVHVDQLKRMRANAWQQLSYYRGLEQSGGEIRDMGPATAEGVACQKIAFVHSEKIIFYRFFEAATGRLVFTETESGATLREEGEIVAGGIRFPKTVVTVTKNGDKTQTVTIVYDKITLNESFPASVFAIPTASLNQAR